MDIKKAKVITGPKIIVRKSVFYASVFSVTEEKAARDLVKELKRKDRKARHIAFAFRIGGNHVIEGMYDNGEPRGTAGLPILTLLRHKKLSNILVTVTRYWGRIKLGPGNLKRVYMNAAKEALKDFADPMTKE